MKAIIFAGGIGTRLWPLSRKKSPKQFEKIIDGKSTLQLTIERVSNLYKPTDIYIATSVLYENLIKNQFPAIPKENIIAEPEKRDAGPAVGLAMSYLYGEHPDEPVLILWSDHLIKNEQEFTKVINVANQIIKEQPEKIIFIGQKARFANENLGWIEVGKEIDKINDISLYAFHAMRYKPNKKLAEYYFRSKKYCWNLGYFVSTPRFIHKLYEQFSPDISSSLGKIFSDKKNIKKNLNTYYSEMPSINFDNAILEKLNREDAYVIHHDIGWSDIGAWDAFKEALEKNEFANVTQGKVLTEDCQDSLIYNTSGKQTIICLDLKHLLVICTDDAVLVADKYSIPKLKKVVEGFEGTELEHLA